MGVMIPIHINLMKRSDLIRHIQVGTKTKKPLLYKETIMRTNVTIILVFLISSVFLSFTYINEIGNCFISFTNPGNLTATAPGRLPATSEKVRTIKTDKGEVEVSRIDGYRVLYTNNKKAPFVNLKVELSEKNSYANDKKNLIDNLKFITANTPEMETKDLIELEFNGYKVYGVSRKTIISGNILGLFMLFPENGVTVFFDFLNTKPEFRNFTSVEDYKKLRDQFIDEYTKYLKICRDK